MRRSILTAATAVLTALAVAGPAAAEYPIVPPNLPACGFNGGENALSMTAPKALVVGQSGTIKVDPTGDGPSVYSGSIAARNAATGIPLRTFLPTGGTFTIGGVARLDEGRGLSFPVSMPGGGPVQVVLSYVEDAYSSAVDGATCVQTIVDTISSVTAKLPKMTGQAAHHYSIVALQRRFKGTFYLGGSRIVCNRRISRAKIRCSVSWFQGDGVFSGHTSIWYSRDRIGRVSWNYSYDITGVDDYCYRVAHRSLKRCSMHYHVS